LRSFFAGLGLALCSVATGAHAAAVIHAGLMDMHTHVTSEQSRSAPLERFTKSEGDVAAHAHGAEGIRRAVRAGVDSIEHGTFMDDQTMKLMREKGTWCLPTISAGRWVYEKAQDPTCFPAMVTPRALAVGPQIQQTFARAWKAGVPIMFGTDCGVCEHGCNAKEFAYMVEAGMPALEAIKSATIVPAR
jgi:imidazolonepropionase-like amidohydrolase